MNIEIHNLIGESTTYEKKERLERRKPKSWLKSISAFANGKGGVLLFGISDDNNIVGLENAKEDAEFISEQIKVNLDPVPQINLEFKEIDNSLCSHWKRISYSQSNSVKRPCNERLWTHL